VLPEGCYHCFTCDERDGVFVMFLFQGDLVWTPINRPCNNHEARRRDVADVLQAAA